MGYTLTVKNRLHAVWDNGSLICYFEVVVKTATVVLRSEANLKAKTFCSALTTTTPDGVIVHTGTTTIPVPFELASDILPPLVTHLQSYGFRLKQDASGATNNSYWKVEAWKQWKKTLGFPLTEWDYIYTRVEVALAPALWWMDLP